MNSMQLKWFGESDYTIKDRVDNIKKEHYTHDEDIHSLVDSVIENEVEDYLFEIEDLDEDIIHEIVKDLNDLYKDYETDIYSKYYSGCELDTRINRFKDLML